jgi:hypothetical protein
MIIRTSAGHLFQVRPAEGIDHAWLGIPVKQAGSGYAFKARAVERLVRKKGCYEVDRDAVATVPVSFAEAKATVRALGFSLTKRDGEYRLAPLSVAPPERENFACYTDDLDDAIGTARAEAARVAKVIAERPWCYDVWVHEVAMEEAAVAGLPDSAMIKLPVGDAALESVGAIKRRTAEKRALIVKFAGSV